MSVFWYTYVVRMINVRTTQHFIYYLEEKIMKNRKLRKIGLLVCIIMGLEIESVFYYVFGINPLFISPIFIVALWTINSILVGCIVDEYFKRKFHIRLL